MGASGAQSQRAARTTHTFPPPPPTTLPIAAAAFRHRQLPTRSFLAFLLTNSVDVAADRLYLPLADWSTLLSSMHPPLAMRILARCLAPDSVAVGGSGGDHSAAANEPQGGAQQRDQTPSTQRCFGRGVDEAEGTELRPGRSEEPAWPGGPPHATPLQWAAGLSFSPRRCVLLRPVVRFLRQWLGRKMRSELIRYHLRASYLITSFITAHSSAQQEMRWMFGSRHDFMHRQKDKVVAESRAAVAAATRFLRELAALPIGPVHTQAGYEGGRAVVLLKEVATRQVRPVRHGTAPWLPRNRRMPHTLVVGWPRRARAV